MADATPLLEDSPLHFPGEFAIKIMGAGEIDLRALAIELVRRHAPDLDESRVRVRDSRTGRYRAVTVVIRATARAQLDAIYQDLSAHPQIAFVL